MTEPTTSSRRALARRSDGRLYAGVAGGVADHLGVEAWIVRGAFALLLGNGIGFIAYLVLWALVPADDDDGSGSSRLRRPKDVVRAFTEDRPADPRHRRWKLVGYLLLGSIAGAILGAFGISFGGTGAAPILIAVIGAALIWWQAPDAQREQWTSDARRYRSVLGGRRGSLLVVLGGVVLVVVGVAAFLAAHDALAQARAGALAIGATVAGVLLVTGPWLSRLIRELTAERRARIREQERAEVAAHVHDSVLQTLALIQSNSADPAEVRRLARRQERELRNWLYPPSVDADADAVTFATALRAAAADVEDAHGVSIEVVVVGDRVLDDGLKATVAAAREAMTNAAKSSGADVVSLFAEVGERGVEVFVRDRGAGFDLDRVPPDRRGIRESIVGRMTRHGGTAAVRTGAGGTEVALALQWKGGR